MSSLWQKKKAVKHKSTNEVLFHRLNLDDFGRYVGFALFLRLHFVDLQSSRNPRFCLLWDNLLIPANMIVNADMKMKKDW